MQVIPKPISKPIQPGCPQSCGPRPGADICHEVRRLALLTNRNGYLPFLDAWHHFVSCRTSSSSRGECICGGLVRHRSRTRSGHRDRSPSAELGGARDCRATSGTLEPFPRTSQDLDLRRSLKRLQSRRFCDRTVGSDLAALTWQSVDEAASVGVRPRVRRSHSNCSSNVFGSVPHEDQVTGVPW